MKNKNDYPGIIIFLVNESNRTCCHHISRVELLNQLAVLVGDSPENIDSFDGPFAKHKDFLIIKTPGSQKVIVPSDWSGLDCMGERILPRGTSLKVLEIHPLTDRGNCFGQNIVEGRRAIVCEIVQ